MDCALNEFFLQMVSAAPKQNGRLVNIMSVVLQSFVAIEEGALGTYALEVQTALQGVARCFRGLLALLSPEIGILGSKSTDVEAVSRNKYARQTGGDRRSRSTGRLRQELWPSSLSSRSA